MKKGFLLKHFPDQRRVAKRGPERLLIGERDYGRKETQGKKLLLIPCKGSRAASNKTR